MTLSKVIWCDRGWQPVHFGFCPDEAAWRREMKRLNVTDEPYPTSDARVTVFERSKDNRQCVIVTVANSRERPKLEVVGLLVHEAAHVWQHVREFMGEKSPSIEFEAYAMQAISQSLFVAFEQTRGRLFR